MTDLVVLSHLHAHRLLDARAAGQATAETSLDLGLSTARVSLQAEQVRFPGGSWLPWGDLEEIAADDSVCFAVEDNRAAKIQIFSESLNRFYSLMPTPQAPTLLVSGIPMHRIQGTDPHQDTLSKIRSLKPVTGHVLDTCTGLGYTAIEAAKTAEQVWTIELDPAVLEIAHYNPWSQPLFERPGIQQIVGDALDQIVDMEDEGFDRVIHDPPMFSLAGELYSGECYRHLYRILKRKGRLFHYVGDPDSRSGRNITRGVVRRLQEAGFSRIVRRPDAFGLVAYK
ncbi:MAG: RsmD family RNA methyltransferase [Anaerolineae bacterium]|jgi:hypothetical protein